MASYTGVKKAIALQQQNAVLTVHQAAANHLSVVLFGSAIVQNA
jgi:hypothetical protein